MHRHHSKRKQLLQRVFIYGLMTSAAVALTAVSLFLVLGYQINRTSGTIEQGGLVQFRSNPQNATITLDDTNLNFRTPGKRNVAAGDHQVKMNLAGYRQWTKQFTLSPGELLWLNYARFIPEKLDTTSVRTFDAVSSTLASDNRQWIAMVENKQAAAVTLVDIGNDEKIEVEKVVLPTDSYTAAKASRRNFSVVEWDASSRYVLVRYEFGENVEYLRVDRENPESVVNITDQAGIPLQELRFSSDNQSVLFARSAGDLYQIDISSDVRPKMLVSNVIDFTVHRANTVSYTASIEDEQITAGVYKDDEAVIAKTLNESDGTVLVSLGEYFGDSYLAVYQDKQIEIFRNPSETSTQASSSFSSYPTSEVRAVHFSNSGRFLSATTTNGFITYDLEKDRRFNVDVPDATPVNAQSLEWFDNYYIWSDYKGTLRLVEFDGGNGNSIAEVVSGHDATLSRDGEWLYSFGRNDQNKLILQRTQLVLKP